ncbi:MAG: hypothetical protein Q6373_005140 [Candidatus Sigynarchaeota archaeon]
MFELLHEHDMVLGFIDDGSLLDSKKKMAVKADPDVIRNKMARYCSASRTTEK